MEGHRIDLQKIPASVFLCLAAADMAQIDASGIDLPAPSLMIQTFIGSDLFNKISNLNKKLSNESISE